MYTSSDEDGAHYSDDADSHSCSSGGSEHEARNKRRRDVEADQLAAYRSGRARLRFTGDNDSVFCPVCTSRDPKLDLQALWQHAKDVAVSHNAKKRPQEHAALQTFVAVDLLRLPSGRVPPMDVARACAEWKQRKSARQAGQPPPPPPADVPPPPPPLSPAQNQPATDPAERPAKLYKAFVDITKKAADELDTLQIAWPPCVIISSVTQGSGSRPGSSDARARFQRDRDLVQEWMRSLAKFDLYDKITFKSRWTADGPTGDILCKFPDRLDGFLEAVHLDLLLRSNARHHIGSKGISLRGSLALAADVKKGWSQAGVRDALFRATILKNYRREAQIRLNTLTENMEKETQVRSLQDEASASMSRFNTTKQELERELGETKALALEVERCMQAQIAEQRARLAAIQDQFQEQLTAKDGEMDAVSREMQQLSLQMEMRQEQELDRKTRELTQKYHEERQQLVADHKRATLDEKAKYEEELAKMKNSSNNVESTRRELEAAKRNRAWVLQERRLNDEHKKEMERKMSIMRKAMEEEFANNMCKFKEKYDSEVDAVTEHRDWYESMVNALHTKFVTANDMVTQVNDYSKTMDEESHWALGTACQHIFKYPSPIYIRWIGDLSTDAAFNERMWRSILEKHNFPAHWTMTQAAPDRDIDIEKFERAHLLHATATSTLQEAYIKNPEWMPFRTVPTQDGGAAEVPVEEAISALVQEHGRAVAEAVRAVKKELLQYNASGDYEVRAFWNKEASPQRRATPLEVLKVMDKRGRELQRMLGKQAKPRAARRATRSGSRQASASARSQSRPAQRRRRELALGSESSEDID
mmetsp:Transcript_34293/g.86403  ORF Transcript_34293/g.86403 Transcript_34293/m.86403 type:complete len:819 (-) Transcript_34293:500-2956(-)